MAISRLWILSTQLRSVLETLSWCSSAVVWLQIGPAAELPFPRLSSLPAARQASFSSTGERRLLWSGPRSARRSQRWCVSELRLPVAPPCMGKHGKPAHHPVPRAGLLLTLNRQNPEPVNPRESVLHSDSLSPQTE